MVDRVSPAAALISLHIGERIDHLAAELDVARTGLEPAHLSTCAHSSQRLASSVWVRWGDIQVLH